MNQQQLLKRLDAAWAELNASYAGLSDSHLTEPGVLGDWSVKDILAHKGRSVITVRPDASVVTLVHRLALERVGALVVSEDGQHIAALTYVAGSLGAIYAGDLLTLFLFWEVMAFSSVFLIFFNASNSFSSSSPSTPMSR